MDLNISKTALDRSHRIGSPKSKKKSGDQSSLNLFDIMIEQTCKRIKKCLKGKGKSITESITAFRMQKLKSARDEHGLFNALTVDGKIMFKNSDNGKPNVYYGLAG